MQILEENIGPCVLLRKSALEDTSPSSHKGSVSEGPNGPPQKSPSKASRCDLETDVISFNALLSALGKRLEWEKARGSRASGHVLKPCKRLERHLW